MSDKKMFCYRETLAGACGVAHVSDFFKDDSGYYPEVQITKAAGGGAGWLTAAFIEDEECEAAYNDLCRAHGAPVYQTPVRVNNNTRRPFFFAIWDTR